MNLVLYVRIGEEVYLLGWDIVLFMVFFAIVGMIFVVGQYFGAMTGGHRYMERSDQ